MIFTKKISVYGRQVNPISTGGPHPGFLDLAMALWCFPKTVLTDQAVKLEN
jgi:hypothetical protein